MPLEKFGEYGFIGLIVGALFFIVWRMLVWVMSFVKDITEQHNKERQMWGEITSGMKQAIDTHNQNANEFKNSQMESNRYTRSEHEKMIELLVKMNENYKDA